MKSKSLLTIAILLGGGFLSLGYSYLLDNLPLVGRAGRGANESRRNYISKTIEDEKPIEYKPSAQTQAEKKLQKAEEYILKEFSKEFKIDKIIRKSKAGSRLKRPISYKYAKRKIIIHHTAESNEGITNTETEVLAIQNIYKFHTFSRDRGDIGYNYLIGPLGTIYEGRAGGSDAVGAHATRNNTESLGIALLGNFDKEKPTQAQLNSLKKLIVALGQKYKINPLNDVLYHEFNGSSKSPYIINTKMDSIVGHGDVGSTSCPGKNLYELLPELKLSMAQDLGYSKKPPTKKPSIEEIKPSYISPTPPAIIRGKKKIINNVDNAVRN